MFTELEGCSRVADTMGQDKIAMLTQASEQNYYEVLGVSRYATRETIHDAYREIARLYHPDSNFYTEIIEDPVKQQHLRFFQEATEAYSTLSNIEKKKRYDKQLGEALRDWEEEEQSSGSFKTSESPQDLPEIVQQGWRSWFIKSPSMQDLIEKHQGRTKRRMMKFALAAPFLLIIVVCVLMNFVRN